MARQLFYGKLGNATPIGNGSNSYIRVRFNATTSSTTLTNVTDESGYFGQDKIRVGQILVESSAFPSGTVITAVDTANNTITVEDNPLTAESQGLGRISPPQGEYYIASASLKDPITVNPTTFNDITGSNDTDFTADGIVYAILGQATDSGNNLINGRFHKYNITEVFYRDSAGSEGSIYVKWSEKGSESDSGEQLDITANQKIATVALSPSESLAPIFTPAFSGITDLNVGQGVAAYQIEVQDFFDDLVAGVDVYYTGSSVKGNAEDLFFTGSGVTVTSTGSRGVIIDIPGGGGGDLFPYTGSAKITGSLEVIGFTNLTGSLFIEGTSGEDALSVAPNGGEKAFSVNSEGVVTFAQFDSTPTAVSGGLMYSQSDFWIGD